jgi:hypothetical protein
VSRQERRQRRFRIRGAAIRQAILDDIQPIYLSPSEYRMYVAAIDQERGTMTIDWARECDQAWPLQPCEVGR